METSKVSSFSALQDRFARGVGLLPERRAESMRLTMRREAGDAASYWLQILLSMGIATLGLVLGSTGVVIGAMLISPLMGPIVELAMGLTVGSPFLVLRSAWRVATSILIVVGASAGLTALLPFHELTNEINARTSPNVLDLIIAAFCAFAAAFTTVRVGSGTASTAAGTAIGISLVPPLCVVGYGLGTATWHVARGAMLLFTANFSAIVLFGSLSFLLVGYSQVPISEVEEEALAGLPQTSLLRRASRGARRVFHPPWGSLLRALMPVLLVGAVFVPLRRALSEVSWQVRVRGEVVKLLDQLPHTALRTSLSVERSGVTVRLLVVGKADEAQRLQDDLSDKIREVSGVQPRVEVTSVADEKILREMAQIASRPEEKAVLPPEPAARLFRRDLEEAFGRYWPEDAAGRLSLTEWVPRPKSHMIRVVHIGAPLGAAGEALLSRSLSEQLGVVVEVEDIALPVELRASGPDVTPEWLAAARASLHEGLRVPQVRACIEVPAADPKSEVRILVRATLLLEAARWGERASVRSGENYVLRLGETPCPPEEAPAMDAGAPDAEAPDADADRGASRRDAGR